MNCPGCRYPLWNLSARQCPECGRPFKPSEFDFRISKVRFCCPRCDQAYYGTSELGHLVPPAFECVKCHTPVTMDEMVLRPGEGVDERQTQLESLPFEDREIGAFKRYWKTVGLAMVKPNQLGKALTREGRGWAATRFLLYTQTLAIAGSVGIFLVLISLMVTGVAGATGGGGMDLAAIAIMLSVLVGVAFGALAVAVLFALLWAVIAHLIMAVGGRTAGGFPRTWVTLCYSGGANVVTGVPIVGGYVGGIWWIVSACIAFRNAQQVSTARAVCAGVLPPVLMVLGFVAAYFIFIFAMIGAAGGFAGGMGPAMPQTVSIMNLPAATLDHPNGIATVMADWPLDGQSEPNAFIDTRTPFPAHGIAYLIDGSLQPDDVRSQDAEANGRGFVGPFPISVIPALPDDQAQTLYERLVRDESGRPHRVGSVVFTYPGMQPGIEENPNAGPLWVAVVVLPTDAVSTVFVPAYDTQTAALVTLDPLFTRVIPVDDLPEAIETQNSLRAEFGLPPLPDPRSIGTDAAP